MSAYLSNLLTHTTSRYNTLRRTLLSNEDDGDTEDDSHITRVLRAYYVEKGRPFPPWLPPDPKDRRAQQSHLQQGGQPAGYYNNRQVASVQGQASSNRSSLSDLWDPPSSQAQSQVGQQQPLSLRNVRRPPVQAGGPAPAPQHGATLGPRPMPAQREGSYQSIASQHSTRSAVGDGGPVQQTNSGGGGTAQERLKARLWGGGARGGPSLPQSQGGAHPPASNNIYDNGGPRGYNR